ncbi:hypothetical protein ACIQVL_05615 [Streptomyces sp. NPDC090499]
MLFFLLRSNSLTPGAAFIAVMFGFFLASTGAAGPITNMTTAIVQSIPNP